MLINPPQVSVVIPTQGRPSVRQAASSAVSQENITCEVFVVVADPRQAAEVESLVGDLGVTILAPGVAVTGAQARNLGVRRAAGAYVAFLDDDDFWEPGKLAAQVELAERLHASSRHVLVATMAYFHASRGKTRLVPRQQMHRSESVGSYLLRRSRLAYGDGFIQTSTLLLDRDLARCEPWDESLTRHQDWDLVMRVLGRADTSFDMVPHPLTHVYQGSTASVSRRSDWRASLRWLDGQSAEIDGRARADFLFSVALRGALASGDLKGIKETLRRVGAPPHAAAVVVGASGAISGLRSPKR